jgi:hypothetical protein
MHYSQIIAITPEALIYNNAQGETVAIEFKQCASHFHAYLLESGTLASPSMIDDAQEFRGIGWRDAFAKPPYIELFSQPRLRIEFPQSWRWLFPYKKFTAIHDQLVKAGWRTLDLG